MEAEKSFESLIQESRKRLAIIRDEGVNQFIENDFEKAESLAITAKKVENLIEALENAQTQWIAIMPNPLDQGSRKKSFDHNFERGTVTPHNKFRLPLLVAITKLGGRGQVGEVLKIVEEMTKEILKSNDFKFLKTRKEIRWQNAVRWERSHCVKEGLLKSNSSRGIWEITEKGRDYVKEHSV